MDLNARIHENSIAKTGMRPIDLEKIMGAPASALEKGIAQGRVLVTTETGEKLKHAQNLLKAFEIEAAFRAEGK